MTGYCYKTKQKQWLKSTQRDGHLSIAPPSMVPPQEKKLDSRAINGIDWTKLKQKPIRPRLGCSATMNAVIELWGSYLFDQYMDIRHKTPWQQIAKSPSSPTYSPRLSAGARSKLILAQAQRSRKTLKSLATDM